MVEEAEGLNLATSETLEAEPEQALTEAPGLAGVFSLEGVLMISIALLLDIIGIILTIVDFAGVSIPLAEGISWISDVIGLLIFGFWMFCRWVWFKGRAGATPEQMPRPQELSQQRKKALQEMSAKGKKAVSEAQKIARSGARVATKAVRFGRLIFAFAIEIIPGLGALPCWTIMVYSEMKKNGPMLV